jgi:uncharacterized C2H2 Zn-finger protein
MQRCPMCGRWFKNQRALAIHMFHCKGFGSNWF